MGVERANGFDSKENLVREEMLAKQESLFGGWGVKGGAMAVGWENMRASLSI